MPAESHTILDGKVHVYRRENSRYWQCATYLGGRNHRQTTGQTSLALALDFAREWYMDRFAEERLRRRGLGPAEAAECPPAARAPAERGRAAKAAGPTFREAADAFLAEYQVITFGERSELHVKRMTDLLRLHVTPFFGDRALSQITSGLVQDYRVHRLSLSQPDSAASMPGQPPLKGRRPSRSSMNKEIVVLRQVLKTANRKGWISALPDFSAPYRTTGKITHRAWFSPDEYKRLYEATRERARNPKNERWRGECEQFHDYVLFMVNTGLRPDEASRLQYRDVTVVVDDDTGERILEIEVRGKRGVGFCKSMPGAVIPFQRMRKRSSPEPADLIFGTVQRELLNAVLTELSLKRDRDGNSRTAYSLRHTYICMRLMEGADIYQIAKNCRTSVEMIETFYASHIKNTLDASAINVRKKPKARKSPSAHRAPANA